MVVDATNYKPVNTNRRIFSCVEPLRLLCIVGGEFESRQSGGEAGHARSYTSFTISRRSIRLCYMNEANSSHELVEFCFHAAAVLLMRLSLELPRSIVSCRWHVFHLFSSKDVPSICFKIFKAGLDLISVVAIPILATGCHLGPFLMFLHPKRMDWCC